MPVACPRTVIINRVAYAPLRQGDGVGHGFFTFNQAREFCFRRFQAASIWANARGGDQDRPKRRLRASYASLAVFRLECTRSCAPRSIGCRMSKMLGQHVHHQSARWPLTVRRMLQHLDILIRRANRVRRGAGHGAKFPLRMQPRPWALEDATYLRQSHRNKNSIPTFWRRGVSTSAWPGARKHVAGIGGLATGQVENHAQPLQGVRVRSLSVQKRRAGRRARPRRHSGCAGARAHPDHGADTFRQVAKGGGFLGRSRPGTVTAWAAAQGNVRFTRRPTQIGWRPSAAGARLNRFKRTCTSWLCPRANKAQSKSPPIPVPSWGRFANSAKHGPCNRESHRVAPRSRM